MDPKEFVKESWVEAKNVALASIFAGLYAAIGYTLPFISFLQIQCRVSDALYPLIAVFGLPSLVGLVVGHFALNLSSPLGPLDLVSVLLFIPAKVAILKWGLKAVPLHVLSVALWVPFMLWIHPQIEAPYWISVGLVGIGEFVAEIGLGVPLAIGIKRRLKNIYLWR